MSRLSSTFALGSKSVVSGGKLNNRYIIDISGAVGHPVISMDRETSPANEVSSSPNRRTFEHYYVRELQEQIFYREKQIEELRREVEAQMRKHPSYVEEAHMMMERLRTLENETSKLSQDLKNKIEQTETQRAETSKSSLGLARLQNTQTDEKTSIAAQRSSAKALFVDKEADLKNLERLYIEKKSELERVVTLTKSHDEQAARLTQQITDAKSEFTALETISRQTTEKIKVAQNQAAELATKSVDAEGFVNRSTVLKDSLIAELECVERRIRQLTAAHDDELAYCAHLQAQQRGLMNEKDQVLKEIENAKKRLEIKYDDPRVRTAALSRQREVLAVMKHLEELEREKQELEVNLRIERSKYAALIDGGASKTNEKAANEEKADLLGVNQLALREKLANEKKELYTVEKQIKETRREIVKLKEDKKRLRKAVEKISEKLLSRDQVLVEKQAEIKRLEKVLDNHRASQSARWVEFEKLAEKLKSTASDAINHNCPAYCDQSFKNYYTSAESESRQRMA